MKQLLIYIAILLITISTTAQIKIGLPLGLADSSAVLDLSNSGGLGNKGFLLPQVNLSSAIVWGLLGTVVTDGMMVFNKATAGSGTTAVLPGLYFWASGKWTLMSQTTATTASFPYCNSSTFSPAPATGVLYNNTAYSATYSLGYLSGSGLTYNSVTQTVSGLTLTRTAGTYAAGGGNVVYTLNGTYTGANNGTVSFTMAECGNTVVYGAVGTMDNIRANLTASAASYDAALANTWVQVTTTEYANLQSNITGMGLYGESNAGMNAGSNSGWGPNQVLTGNAFFVPANNWVYGLSFCTSNAPASTTASALGVGMSTLPGSSNGNFSSFPAGTSIPAMASVTQYTRYYFVVKKPSNVTASTTYYCLFVATSGMASSTGFNSAPQYSYSPFTGTVPNITHGTFTSQSNNGYENQLQFLATATRPW